MIKWIVSSSVLIAVIIALRHVLKGKISLQLQYALWVLVLLRLLIPISFGASGFSIENLMEKAAGTETVKTVSKLTHQKLPHATYNSAQSKVIREYGEMASNLTQMPKGELVETADYKILSQMGGRWSWDDIFNALWVFGIIAVVLILLTSNIRFAIKLNRLRYKLDIPSCPLPVYISEDLETPCLFGLFHPAIYITPEGAKDDIILSYIVEHELTHFRHGDHIWSYLRCACLALHWYNPLVWWAAILSCRDGEFACDGATIGRIGEALRAEYGRMLIGITSKKQKAPLVVATTVTGSIKERITLLVKKPKMALYTLVATLVIAAVAVGCTFTGAKNTKNLEDMDLTLYETKGHTVAIANEYIDQLIVHTTDEENRDAVLISVYEKASAEAAIKDGYTDSGLGWLFSLIRYDRVRYERYLCEDGSGLSFFAKDDNWYYGYATATDVRFYPRSNNHVEEQALWDTLNNQVGPSVRDDFIIRNNLTAYMDEEARAEYTYDGEHKYLNYYPYYSINGSKDEMYVLVLSQPARQGEGGIWCVERMTDSHGNVYLWFPDSGMPAAEYYAGIQAECDAGYMPKLFLPEGAAMAFLDESGYFNSTIVEGSLVETDSKGLTAQDRKVEVLMDILNTLINKKTPVQLELTIMGEKENKPIGKYEGWGCGNDVQLSRALTNFNYAVAPVDEIPTEEQRITIIPTQAEGDWTVDFYENSNYLCFNTDGKTTCYTATSMIGGGDYPPIGSAMRLWYDEAQWLGIGGSYMAQGQIVIPDDGQDYLTAAREYCEAFEGKHLTVTEGSMFCYTYVSLRTESAEDTTAHFRKQGEIGESTYAFYLTTVFVPENDRALFNSMAGNTREYAGNDPDVPKGAYEYFRCGYITLEEDGWHGELVGTGW